jgi:nitroreductase
MSSKPDASPGELTRPLRRVRQIREYTTEPPTSAELDAIADAARWTGSSRNVQPWRFLVIRDAATLRSLAAIGQPQTRPFATAPIGIAVVLTAEEVDAVWAAYDEGRAVERILVAATLLGLGAGITWIRRDVHSAVAEVLDLPDDRRVRTIVAVGHPTAAALLPKSAPGMARLPRSETVLEGRWPTDRR